MLKRLIGAAMAAACALAGQAVAKDPVVMVHGYTGKGSSFETYRGWFGQDGFQTYVNSYDWTRSNRTTAVVLDGWVDAARQQFGADKVDIVGHSMGALNSRYYLKFVGGTQKVRDWISIGGVNYGTTVAVFCFGGLFDDACAELLVGSSILNDLNAGDDTPGTTRYGAAWSGCDLLIQPVWNATIAGGSNFYVGCKGHSGMLSDFTTYRTVRGFID
jgi:triacylglycerol lipase